MQKWVAEQRALSGRLPRRYASIEDALKRMQEANGHLSPEQARHLTQNGVNQNEDGTYSWKFDNYVRADSPYGMTKNEIEELWGRSAARPSSSTARKAGPGPPTPRRTAAWRISKNAKVVAVDGAGHWCITIGCRCS